MRNLKYALVGNGRLASHLYFYLKQLGQHVAQWSRSKDDFQTLLETVKGCDVVLLAVQDAAIEGLAQSLAQSTSHPPTSQAPTSQPQCVHFSGALVTKWAQGCHPLMTFGKTLYASEFYPRIPFTVEEGVDFAKLFPALKNPVFTMSLKDRAYYHALCVIAGNFTTLLWQKVGQKFQNDLHLSPFVLTPYLEKIAEQIARSPENALSGPFARKDYRTIELNLAALERAPELKRLYQAFCNEFVASPLPLEMT